MTPVVDDGRGLPLVASAAGDAEVDAWARGGCHIFALALHDRHGWPLRVCGSPADAYSIRPFSAQVGVVDHVFCVRGDGRPVDVYGVWADEVAVTRFFAHPDGPDEPRACGPASRPQVVALGERHAWPAMTDAAMRAAQRSARRLALDRLGR